MKSSIIVHYRRAFLNLVCAGTAGYQLLLKRQNVKLADVFSFQNSNEYPKIGQQLLHWFSTMLCYFGHKALEVYKKKKK